MKIFKILAMFLVTAILCLTIGNAVTGHGIKGNSNLNVTVLANETGTGTGTEGGTANKKKELKDVVPIEISYSDEYTSGSFICFDTLVKCEVWCGPGGSEECEVGYDWRKDGLSCRKK